jgi:hypothetical protein
MSSLTKFLSPILLFSAFSVLASDQAVWTVPSETTVTPGSTIEFDLNYRTADPQNSRLTGLGLRVHFDSRNLAFVELKNVLPLGYLGQQAPQADVSDMDADPATDQFVLVSWSDPGGNWPGSEPVRLATASFRTLLTSVGKTSDVRFSASSTASGYKFVSSPFSVTTYGQELLLSQQSVGVKVDWRSQYNGDAGTALALPQKGEFGFFFFSSPTNPEVFVKVLDFGETRPYLVFFAGLTDFEYRVTFTVVATGQWVSFTKPPGSYVGGADNESLQHVPKNLYWLARDGSTLTEATVLPLEESGASPGATSTELVLSGGQVSVGVTYRSQYSGETGTAMPLPQQDEFGYFYFSSPSNPEVFVKVLDFGATSPFLIFYAGLTDFEYTVTYTNIATGQKVTFTKLGGAYDGGGDNTSLRH